MAAAAKLTRSFSRQLSSRAARVWRQLSLEPHTPRRAAAGAPGAVAGPTRFGLARQSSLDPTPAPDGAPLAMPENLDATMRLLFAACQGDVGGVEELLRGGVDVNSIDFDGRTALHIAACEGRGEVVRLLLGWKANINARDRWGSTGYYVAKWYDSKVFVKILDKDGFSDADSIDAFKDELTLLEKARHPNLVQFVGAVTQNVPMMIVSEYHQKGDLASYLETKGACSLTKQSDLHLTLQGD